jgi:hypothetical protein
LFGVKAREGGSLLGRVTRVEKWEESRVDLWAC